MPRKSMKGTKRPGRTWEELERRREGKRLRRGEERRRKGRERGGPLPRNFRTWTRLL